MMRNAGDELQRRHVCAVPQHGPPGAESLAEGGDAQSCKHKDGGITLEHIARLRRFHSG